MKDETLYYTLSDDPAQNHQLFSSHANYIDDNRPISRAKAFDRTFVDYHTNLSIRGEFNYGDYEFFRENERMPTTPHETMRLSNKAYQKVGPIRNVIDLMGDFGCQGIRLIHPNKSVERFYDRWFEYVRGKEVSERFLNQLYRLGIVFLRRWLGTVSPMVESDMKRIHGEKIDLRLLTPKYREIPLKYTSLNPMAIRIIGGELASSFLGKPLYALTIPTSLSSELARLNRENRDNQFDELLQDPDVKKILGGQAKEVILNPDEIEVFEYKKDDWEIWPRPMIDSILDDVMMLAKMKLADRAALDGVISSVRLWRLGYINESHPTHSIFPTQVGIRKLRSVLANTGNGPIDIVWGPELDFKESESKIYQVLGSQKYDAIWDSIYDGLGVPPALRSSKSLSGQTNAFISLKNLIERLEYGRTLLTRFWMKEIRIVQKAMGFQAPAKVVYNEIIINDESAEKKLLIDLVDRNVISEEAVQERFGYIPDIETIRVKREDRKRSRRKYPPKASPFHNPDKDHELRKLILQSGGVAPSELGLELEKRREGDKTLLERKGGVEDKRKKVPANPGRPDNVIETSKRAPKRIQPRSRGFVDLFLWAQSAQDSIANFTLKPFLTVFEKKNIRSLSNEQFDQYENAKFALLSKIEPFTEVTEECVYQLLNVGAALDLEMVAIAGELVNQFANVHLRQPNIDEMRHIQAAAYAVKFEQNNEE